MIQTILIYFSQALAIAYLPIAIFATIHVVLNKEDERAAIGWVGLIWLSPLIGAALYWFLGINRIVRKAQRLKSDLPEIDLTPWQCAVSGQQFTSTLGEHAPHLRPLIHLVGQLTERPLLIGNAIEPLDSGDVAYPAMIEAIDHAERSVAMSSYIFDNDQAGRMFRDALANAVRRDVEVRVLIDDIGSRYTWPPIVRSLRKAGIPTARFLPTMIPWTSSYTNLRNHRKLLIVDGSVGFTGGMNIRFGNLLQQSPEKSAIHDLHFKLRGPVVAHLLEAFEEDWLFTTREKLEGVAWEPTAESYGNILARGISDGPDEDFDKLRMTLIGAITAARSHVVIITPYFLPDETVLASINVAAKRGVRVQVLLPEVNNLRLVQWASAATLPRALARGCEVWLTPPPFDHSKLMVVDDCWALIGSANWDARSLRLNFEFNVETYDHGFVSQLNQIIQGKLEGARQLTVDELAQRPLPARIRDGIARLASPYL